ncbi:MAG: hypothetical protein NXI24_00055 [bacterium]|nr:hypothetical protein [bacterium]
MIQIVFDWCVEFLIYWAGIFGITYEEINVYLFCVAWPLLTIIQTVWLIALYRPGLRSALKAS